MNTTNTIDPKLVFLRKKKDRKGNGVKVGMEPEKDGQEGRIIFQYGRQLPTEEKGSGFGYDPSEEVVITFTAAERMIHTLDGKPHMCAISFSEDCRKNSDLYAPRTSIALVNDENGVSLAFGKFLPVESVDQDIGEVKLNKDESKSLRRMLAYAIYYGSDKKRGVEYVK